MSQQFVCRYWQTNRKVGQQRDRLWHPVAQWQVHTMYWQRFTSKWSRSCCMSILYWVLMRSIAFKLSYKAGQRCEGTAGHRDPGRTRVDSRRNVLLKYSPVLFVSVVGSGWPLCACLVQTDGWFHWVCVCVCVCACVLRDPRSLASSSGLDCFVSTWQKNLAFTCRPWAQNGSASSELFIFYIMQLIRLTN